MLYIPENHLNFCLHDAKGRSKNNLKRFVGKSRLNLILCFLVIPKVFDLFGGKEQFIHLHQSVQQDLDDANWMIED